MREEKESKNGASGEQAFRTRAMRDRLLGLWAAKALGLDGGDALAYAAEVTNADAEGGEGAMIGKIVGDLAREEVAIQPEMVEDRMRRFANEARDRLGPSR